MRHYFDPAEKGFKFEYTPKPRAPEPDTGDTRQEDKIEIETQDSPAEVRSQHTGGKTAPVSVSIGGTQEKNRSCCLNFVEKHPYCSVLILVIVAFGLGIIIGYFVICKLTREKDGSAGGTTGPPYRKQAVATDNEQCSTIANETLTKNGSAVDAAIAAMFCLGVINMHSSGVGGGGVMLVYNRTLKKAKVIDFRETAPMKTTTNMFEPNETGEEKSKYGGLSIAVPGEVHGHYQAWKQHGRLKWRDLVQPAIDLAKNGFEISAAVAQALNDEMVEKIKEDAGLSELLLDKNGKPFQQGDKIKNVKYANTLERIQEDPGSFYNGALARDIALDMMEIKNIKGKITEEDLRTYQTEEREPIESDLSGLKMYLTPPPTSGAVLALILNILKGYHMTSSDRDGVKASVLTYHRIIEAFRFGYAWRSRLGDPAFNLHAQINKVAQQMVEQQLGDRLRGKIQDDRTHDNVSYYAQSFSDADYGTTYVAVLAQNGDAVSMTNTINHRFGSKYRSNLTGIIYNNEMADFDIPGLRPVDGLNPSPVNFPEAGKRPFSSMSPAILTDCSGDVQLVLGASGGKRITTAVSLVLMNKLWFDRSLSDAVEEPRVHTHLVPDKDVYIEKNKKYQLDNKIVEGLRALNHTVIEGKEAAFAVVQAVCRVPGGIDAKSDPRKFGAPAGI